MSNDVISQLRTYLDFASGESVEETLAAALSVEPVVRWYRRGPVLAALRGPTLGLAAMTLVLAMVGGVAMLTQRLAPDSEGTASSDVAEDLLFPPGADALEATVGSRRDDWAAGLVGSPEEVIYRISVLPTTGELDPDDEQRDINGRSFTLQQDDENDMLGYAYLDMCATVVVQTSADSPAWNQEATNLLAALTIEGRVVAAVLPEDWRLYGAGGFGDLYQIIFEAEIGGVSRSVALRQMPGSPIAALPGVGGGRVTETTFNGRQAWIFERTGGYVSLVWMEGDNAVMLEAADVTVDQLESLAATLEPDQRAARSRYVVSTNPVATTPDQSIPNDQATCGPTRLDLTTNP